MNQERNWRDEALDESLGGFNYENHLEAMMAAIRRNQPSWPTNIVGANRERSFDFLREHCGETRSLLSAPHAYTGDDEDDQDEVWAEWLDVEWQGSHVELVYLGGEYNTRIICLAPDENAEKLSRFTRALQDFAARPANRSLIFNAGWEDAPHLDAELGRVTWDDITLPDNILRDLREAVEGFFAQREIIESFGFTWKRGILLVGPPGTGKTMVCKAAAASLPDLPFLYVRSLDGYNPIGQVFTRARKLAPCIVAFEDIDGLISAENRTVFLNEMDGFASNEGLLIIASSNHPGKIDEALLKRPSRFDRVFHLGLPEREERRAFCEHLLQRSSLADRLTPDFDSAALANKVADKTDGFTPAYLKEAFLSAALSRAHAGETSLDQGFFDAVLEQVEELKSHLKRLKDPDALAEMRSGNESIGFRGR